MKPEVFVRREYGSWMVCLNGHPVYNCANNKARAEAIARDVRAGAAVPAFKMPTQKWK